MISEGRHMARAIAGYLGAAKEGKNVPVVIEFQIVSGPHAEEFITSFCYTTTEGSINQTIKSLRACGWAGDDMTDISFPENNKVEITIEHDEYNGNRRAKVKWIDKPGGAKVDRLSEGEARRFAERMKGACRAFDARQKSGEPHPGAKRGAADDDSSDIPF